MLQRGQAPRAGTVTAAALWRGRRQDIGDAPWGFLGLGPGEERGGQGVGLRPAPERPWDRARRGRRVQGEEEGAYLGAAAADRRVRLAREKRREARLESLASPGASGRRGTRGRVCSRGQFPHDSEVQPSESLARGLHGAKRYLGISPHFQSLIPRPLQTAEIDL
jgi:hypothetical protein